MELIWSEPQAERLIYSAVTQALVEGNIPVPEGRTVTEVLSCTGSVTVSDAAASVGAINLEGQVCVELICRDTEVFAFSSRAAFRHTVPAEEVREGMAAEAAPTLQTLEVTRENGRLSLYAVADVACRVTESGAMRVMSGVGGISDAEKQAQSLELSRRVLSAGGVLRLREEVESPLTAAVLYPEATVYVKEATSTSEGIKLTGELTLSALTQTKSGALNQLTQTIPFSEVVEGGGAGKLYASARIIALDARCAEEFGLVVLEVQIEYAAYCAVSERAEIPTDMFSPSLPFRCTHSRLRLSSYGGGACCKNVVSEELAVPDGMPEVQRVAYVTTRPLVTSYGIESGRLSVEGLLFTRVMYAAESGNIFAFSEDVPFSVSLDAGEANDATVSVCASAQAQGDGRSVSVTYSITACAALYAIHSINAVTGIEECEAPEAVRGITIYFAGAGDTLYGVAKRFNVSRSSLLASAPELKEELSTGQKVMVVR